MPVTSSREGNSIWKSVAENYNRISNGLFSCKDSSQLNGKWRNILYHARKFGYPHPLETHIASKEYECELIKRVEKFKANPEIIETETKRERNMILNSLSFDNLKSSTLNTSHRLCSTNVPTNTGKRTLGIFKPNKISKAKIQKQTSLLALQFEQERLRLLVETNKMEQNKLSIEIEVANLQMEREKIKLTACKNEAQIKGLLN